MSRVFPASVQDLVAALLAERAVATRQYARGRLYTMLKGRPALLTLPPPELQAALVTELDRVLATGAASMV